MHRSGGVVPRSLALVLAAVLPGSVLSLSALSIPVLSISALPVSVRADVPQSGFAPNLEAIGIRDIQHQLRAHGYDPGPDSGAMNDTTRTAILAYQHDYGLREDGIAGPALQNMLHFMRRPTPQPAVSSDEAAQPPPPLATLLQPPPPQYEAPAALPPQNPTVLYGRPPASPPPPPPVRYAEPPAAATQAPMALYPSSILPPPASMPAEPSPPVHPGPTIAEVPPAPAQSAPPPPSTLADQDAEVVPPAPLAALLQPPPPIPVLGDIASLAPPPPSREPEATLPDPLAVIAIAVPATHAAMIAHSAYPDPLAAVALEMPVSKRRAKDEEPLPALALPPPIRMPVKTAAASSGDQRPVAEPRIPVARGPLGTDPVHPLPAPAFVPPPFSTAPTDAPELAGDLYVRQVQEYLKQLGYFGGEPNGVLDWATVQALVKFDASGAGPSSVIADPKHLDEIWIARLKTALAAKGAPPEAAPHP